MGEIVNLNRAKKQRAKAAAQRNAKENRAAYGRTATQKANDARVEQRRRDALDGKRPAEPS